MKKVLKVTMIISLILSAVCPILYNVIGSKILKDGTLEEPFYLVVFMWLFILVFMISLIMFLISKKKGNLK